MKPTGNPNLNSRTYWNTIYSDDQKRQAYVENETIGNESMRFHVALEEVKDGDTFLDIGCGVGYLTNMVFIHRPKSEVWGVDISDTVIRDNSIKNPKITYKQGYVGDLKDIPANYFDFVFSGEVLEHIDEPKNLFKDAYNALKPGGKFLITTPNDNHIESDEHVWYFTHEDVENLFIECGFKHVRFIYLPHLEHMLVIMAIGIKE